MDQQELARDAPECNGAPLTEFLDRAGLGCLRSGTGKRPRSRQERREAARFSDEDALVNGIARAIYMTWHRPPAPVWEGASQSVREWVKLQAVSVLAYLRGLHRRTAR